MRPPRPLFAQKKSSAKRVIRSWISFNAQSVASQLAHQRAMSDGNQNNNDDGCGTPPVISGDPGSPEYSSILWYYEYYDAWALELNAIQDYFLTWSRELAEQRAAQMREGEAQAAEIEEGEARLDEYAEWYDDGYRVV